MRRRNAFVQSFELRVGGPLSRRSVTSASVALGEGVVFEVPTSLPSSWSILAQRVIIARLS